MKSGLAIFAVSAVVGALGWLGISALIEEDGPRPPPAAQETAETVPEVLGDSPNQPLGYGDTVKWNGLTISVAKPSRVVTRNSNAELHTTITNVGDPLPNPQAHVSGVLAKGENTEELTYNTTCPRKAVRGGAPEKCITALKIPEGLAPGTEWRFKVQIGHLNQFSPNAQKAFYFSGKLP